MTDEIVPLNKKFYCFHCYRYYNKTKCLSAMIGYKSDDVVEAVEGLLQEFQIAQDVPGYLKNYEWYEVLRWAQTRVKKRLGKC
jgi:hypothetical protein